MVCSTIVPRNASFASIGSGAGRGRRLGASTRRIATRWLVLVAPVVGHHPQPQAGGVGTELPPVAGVADRTLGAHEHVETTVRSGRELGEVERFGAPHARGERHDRHLTRGAELAGDPVRPRRVDWRAAVHGVGVRRPQVLVVATARHERREVGIGADLVEVGVHRRAEQRDVRVGVPRRFVALGHERGETIAGVGEVVHRGRPHRRLHTLFRAGQRSSFSTGIDRSSIP